MPSWIKDEAKWEKAKELVRNQYPEAKDDRFYALATGIYEKMTGHLAKAMMGAIIEEPDEAIAQARLQLEADTQASNNAILFAVVPQVNAAGDGSDSRGRTDPSPTVEEKVSGDYPKRVVGWQGLNISIENETGSHREGVNRDGQKWRQRMPYPYGYINDTTGMDQDHVDVFLGPNLDDADYVYIVHARKVNRWDEYDEDKVMIGFKTEPEAVQAFLASYSDPRFLGPVTPMLVGEFVNKVRNTKDRPTIIKALFVKSEFKESDHPRAEDGTFTSSTASSNSITYTFADNHPIKSLRGKTFANGKVTSIQGKPSVDFGVHEGKHLIATVEGKPELEKQIVELNRAKEAAKTAKTSHIPGWKEYETALHEAMNTQGAYHIASERGYPHKQARAAREADERLALLTQKYPAAAAYAKVLNFAQASNYLKAGAGKKARAKIEAGADPIETAEQMEKEWSEEAKRVVGNS